MEKIIQFGEGNFLRAFADYYIQLANNKNIYDGRVVICQPRSNTKVINNLKNQNCTYNVYLRGRNNGQVVDSTTEINCISRCIDTIGEWNKLIELFQSDNLEVVISNTTEAGICFCNSDKQSDCPNTSFPAKLTFLLYQRFLKNKKGLLILPVELIEDNGKELKKCVLQYSRLWNLSIDFENYIENECIFCNTLVDRIVTGHPNNDVDLCSVACEPYESWIIEGDESCSNIFPISKISDNIKWVDDLKAYRTRKVRILNGTHTMSVLAGYMNGFNIVRDMMQDELFKNYINMGLTEIKQTISMPTSEIDSFATSVIERFDNPFIDHKLLDISLNSVSKFKVRCLDTILDYYEINNTLPKILMFSLSALIAFYTHKGSSRDYSVKDNEEVIQYFNSHSIKDILSNTDFWGINLCNIPNFEEMITNQYNNICTKGINKAITEAMYE